VPPLVDITDNEYYSICGRCGRRDIHDTHLHCPECAYDLGRNNCYTIAPAVTSASAGPTPDTNADFRYSQTPMKKEDFCYVTFECAVQQKLGCMMYGHGPVVVESLLDCPLRMSQGVVLHSQGPYAPILLRRALYPSVGDVLSTVGGLKVDHLSAMEV
jgi:hypothetical protein